jgi:hypothetical protein
MHHWCADKIEDQITVLRHGLKKTNRKKMTQAIQKTMQLFEEMKMQVFKKILIYSLGIAAALLTAIGLILTICITHYYLICFLISTVVATVFAAARQIAHLSLLDQRNWTPNFRACLPKSFQ